MTGHYCQIDEKSETKLIFRFCWKGHTDFAFTEDGIIIIQNPRKSPLFLTYYLYIFAKLLTVVLHRNAPVAADIYLFW